MSKTTSILGAAALLGLGASVAQAAPLPAGTVLKLDAGTNCVEGAFKGSCFIMDLSGFPVPTAISPGTDGGIVIGKDQTSGGQETVFGGLTTPGQITAAWDFFSQFGTFVTSPIQGALGGSATGTASSNFFSDTSCSGTGCVGQTQLGTWTMAWSGVVVDLGSAAGCRSVKCTPNQLAGVMVTNWTIIAGGAPGIDGDLFSLDYSITTPDSWVDFPGSSFKMHLEGTIQAVPIPAAVWLLGSGLLGLFATLRRRRSV